MYERKIASTMKGREMKINSAARITARELKTFKFKLTLGDARSHGVVSFNVEAASQDKAWLQLLKEHKTLLPQLLKIELVSGPA